MARTQTVRVAVMSTASGTKRNVQRRLPALGRAGLRRLRYQTIEAFYDRLLHPPRERRALGASKEPLIADDTHGGTGIRGHACPARRTGTSRAWPTWMFPYLQGCSHIVAGPSVPGQD